MPVTIDGPSKLFIADSGTTALDVAVDLYTAWVDWSAVGDNSKFLQAFRVVGGDPTTGVNKIAPYFFLTNGWRLRPQEANHSLTITGILLVDGGGDPCVNTLGAYNVRVSQVVPIQAQLVESGTSGLTSTESAKLDAITNNTLLIPALV